MKAAGCGNRVEVFRGYVQFDRGGEVERIEGVGRSNCLGRLLDWSDDDWPAVLHNIRKERQVLGRLGKLPWREGVEPTVLSKFYHAVVQAVLLFGSET